MENKQVYQKQPEVETSTSEERHSKSLTHSKLLKYSLIVICLLVFLYLVSVGVITWLTYTAIQNGSSESTTTLIQTVADYIKIEVAGAIGALSTAVIARYGIREATANLKGGKDYNMPD